MARRAAGWPGSPPPPARGRPSPRARLLAALGVAYALVAGACVVASMVYAQPDGTPAETPTILFGMGYDVALVLAIHLLWLDD